MSSIDVEALESVGQQKLDLAVLLLGQQPALVREAFVVAQMARSRGFSARVLHLSSSLTDCTITAQLRDLDACVAAIGATSSALGRSVSAAVAARASSNGPVVLFGDMFAVDAERRKVPAEAVTGVVVGPAGPVVVDVLRTLDRRDDRPIAGLDRLDGDFRPRPPPAAFDEGEFPRFEESDLKTYRLVGLPLRLSYGCTRRCAFCGEQPRQGCYRTRSANAVVEEMVYHYTHNSVRRFNFCDLAINGDLDLVESICEQLMRQQQDLSWWGRAMVDPRMTRALYRTMRLSGCIGLEFEAISGSDKVLAAMGAGFGAQDAGEALSRATSAGMNTRVSFIVGLPGETELEFGETCNWLYAHRFMISTFGDLMPCMLHEGSLLQRYPEQFGIRLQDEDPARNWHDGGFNTASFRLKRTQQLRVYIEDQLHLKIVGRSVEVPWDDSARDRTGKRLFGFGQKASVVNGQFRRQRMELVGVVQQGLARSGPTDLEIDLTNNCNQHCAGCWNHSFLMRDRRLSGQERSATLNFDDLKHLILDAKRLGTRRIQLSGAGEPFMHPLADDVLELIKNEGIEANVVTNFTRIDEARARNLVDLGVDTITISLWAGSKAGYCRTHPKAEGDQFERIVRVLSHLTRYRQQTGCRHPRIKIYNVISNLNCNEIHEMVNVARDAGADLIEFTPIDIVEGFTDELALSESDSHLILDQLLSLRRRRDYLQRSSEETGRGRIPGLEEQGEFARFVQSRYLPDGFRFSLGDIRCWESFCRRGVHCNRVYEEIHRNSAVLFGYPADECLECLALADCGIDPVNLTVEAPYLSLQGFGSFWRRIHGQMQGESDARVVDQVPCTIGYTYARVQANGNVIPCCKATDLPLGNIKDKRFEEIWYSEAYQEFRYKALTLPKSESFFAPIDCYNVCDNLGLNMAVDARLRGLSRSQMMELRRTAGS